MRRFSIEFHREAKKALTHLQPQICQRILNETGELADDPRPFRRCKKLTNVKPDSWRIRVGDYRIVHRVIEAEALVYVFQIDLRNENTYD